MHTTKQNDYINKQNSHFYLGLCLAVSSTVFIGSSFIIKKISLKRLFHAGGLRASAGGYGYLKDWLWWLGLATMGVGELANFAAYAFAPASLVTPLGALSILVSAVLASKYLEEKLTCAGKTGCILCILGSVLIVVNSPKQEDSQSVDELMQRIWGTAFLNYILVVSSCSVICCALIPKYGSRNVVLYVTICSAFGSLTVMACKALGLTLKNLVSESTSGNAAWMLIFLLLSITVCILVQMNYLNRALDVFDTSLVTPVYYVIFTLLVLVASSILFKEWTTMSRTNVLGLLSGFCLSVVSLFLLSYFKGPNCYELVKNSARVNDYNL
ncbi:magnesium transporter NIPA2 [Cylas formicarius]|uniref:magnesium transporter NIPA2 n=1 Tax=Cylas formicarius TaxID=197179 RepID=UPI0029584C22|nr:magnesium transporter NIPA2 [Cylas formicarius]